MSAPATNSEVSASATDREVKGADPWIGSNTSPRMSCDPGVVTLHTKARQARRVPSWFPGSSPARPIRKQVAGQPGRRVTGGRSVRRSRRRCGPFLSRWKNMRGDRWPLLAAAARLGGGNGAANWGRGTARRRLGSVPAARLPSVSATFA